MNSTLTVLCSFGIASGLFLGYRILHRVLQPVVIRFGVETTALVVNAHRSEKDGNVYLHGDYVFTDASGREHTFAFTICADWPGDAQWRKIMYFYRRGQRNRVRYLPWLPSLHEVQTPA